MIFELKGLIKMIELTRLNNVRFALNSDHIELIDSTPDTVLTLANGHKYVVKETAHQVIELIKEFRRGCSLPQVS